MFQLVVMGSKEEEFELETAETPHFQTVLIPLYFQTLGAFCFCTNIAVPFNSDKLIQVFYGIVSF